MRDRKGWRDEWRIPRLWKEELFRVQPGAKTWMLAILLLEEAENYYCPWWFKVPNKALASYGIDRHAKTRGLRELAAMGLIIVEQQPRKSPRVKVLFKRRVQT